MPKQMKKLLFALVSIFAAAQVSTAQIDSCFLNYQAQISKGNPAPFNTIFNVASLTKPVTAMLTLKLVSMGNWHLDEPLAKYWTDPDVVNDAWSKKLTTRHILSHQTGFVNWRWLHNTRK